MDSTQNPAPAAPAVADTEEPEHQIRARSFDQFVRMLEDGNLVTELTDELKRIADELRSYQMAFGGKPKAKLTVNFAFTLDGGVTDIVADFKSTLPKVKREKSVAWLTSDGSFSPENPKQGNLFGRKPARVV